MHYDAELGIAARFAYDRLKDSPEYAKGGVAMTSRNDSWIRRLIQWRANPKQALKVDIFDTTILVISPKQELVEIPAGSSALDYAFKIHSRLGLHAREAVINGVKKPVTAKLSFGDVVEIIEDEAVTPSADWLTAVVTPSAKSHIKSALDKKVTKEPLPQAPTIKSGRYLISLYHTQQTGILPAVLELLSNSGVTVEKTNVHTTGLLSKSPTITVIAQKITDSAELNKKLCCIAGVTKASIKPIKE